MLADLKKESSDLKRQKIDWLNDDETSKVVVSQLKSEQIALKAAIEKSNFDLFNARTTASQLEIEVGNLNLAFETETKKTSSLEQRVAGTYVLGASYFSCVFLVLIHFFNSQR